MIILDGAMGTELQRRGYDTSLPLWSARALLENPDAVRQIHHEYVAAGADVITTNTFRTHRRNAGDTAEELTRLAVRLCKEVGAPRVAGSVSPLEDCYSPGLSVGEQAFEEHREMAGWLADAGVDLLLVETMPMVDEAAAATKAAKETGLPVWVSLVPNGAVALDGAHLREAFLRLIDLGPEALLVNCNAMELVEDGVSVLRGVGVGLYGGYANNGTPAPDQGWRFDRELPVTEFREHAERMLDLGASIIGGCCGTTPEHIEVLAALRTERRAE